MKLFFIYLFAYLTSTACTSKVEVAPDNIRTTKKCTTAAALATAECAKITKELLVDLTTATTELTNRVSLPFVVKFSESVSDFTESDISVSGGAVGSFEGSGTDYKFSVTPSADGEVKVSIAKEVAEDANKNKNQASLIITRKFDGSRPSVVLATTSSTPTSVTPIPVTATFSESVTDFTSADITVTNGTVAGFTGAEASYSFNVIPSGNGTVTITVADGLSIDAATNTNTASNVISVVYDSQQPSVVLTSSALSETSASPIPVTITFSSAVTGFDVSDLTVTSASLGNFVVVSGTVYTVDVTPGGQGAVTVDVASSVAVSIATSYVF